MAAARPSSPSTAARCEPTIRAPAGIASRRERSARSMGTWAFVPGPSLVLGPSSDLSPRPRTAGPRTDQGPRTKHPGPVDPLVVSARTKYAMGLTEGHDMINVSITVNGKVRKAHVEPRLLLAHFLREQLNL